MVAILGFLEVVMQCFFLIAILLCFVVIFRFFNAIHIVIYVVLLGKIYFGTNRVRVTYL